jgi:hypothetical protein
MTDPTADDDAALYADIIRLRPTAEFQAHFERLFTPMVPGFNSVLHTDRVFEEYEYELLDVFDDPGPPPALLARMKLEGQWAAQTFKTLIIDTLEKSIVQFIHTPDMFGGDNFTWNATNSDALSTNMEAFLSMNVDIWKEFDFVEYKESLRADVTLTPAEYEDVCLFVKEYIEWCALYIPREVENAQDVYYDSATTEEGEGDD